MDIVGRWGFLEFVAPFRTSSCKPFRVEPYRVYEGFVRFYGRFGGFSGVLSSVPSTLHGFGVFFLGILRSLPWDS